MTSYKLNIQLGETVIIIHQKNEQLKKYLKTYKNSEGIIVLKHNECHDSIYNKILDNISNTFTFNMFINALLAGVTYFDELVISCKTQNRVSSWVKSLGKYSYTWNELLNKPDYGLELFNKRFWPYFNVESKDWHDIATATLRDGEYPNQTDVSNTTTDSERDEISRDYKLEYGISQKYNNYLGYAVLDPSKYINISKIIKKLVTLEKLGMKKLLFEAVLRLLISPETCHIIKNPDLIILVTPLFDENKHYRDIFIHFMYYAMFILNHEDTIMFSQIKRTHRIIFSHNEALCMPQTHTYHIELDPYIQQLTGDTYLIQSLPYYLRCKRYIQPINVFERRFYLATGGALANIPLEKYNAAVSGSILIPCLTYSELEDDFKRVRFNTARNIKTQMKFNDNLYSPIGNNKLTEDEKDFMSYLEYLYPSYHSLNNSEYISNVLTEIDSTNNSNSPSESPDTKKDNNYNILSDIDISISVDNYDTFKELAGILASHIQKNCSHIGAVWLKKVNLASSFKYKIYGPGLIRPIDLFRVPYGPDKMVKKFHCPIVRSWYDGSNRIVEDSYNHTEEIDKYWATKVNKLDNDYNNSNSQTITPLNDVVKTNINYVGINIINSCVCAMLSGVNNNYKWFFNSKPCVEVILKYAQRGYSTICNKKEITALHEYMKTTPRWKSFIHDNIDMCGSISKEHIFFNPCINSAGIRYKLREFKKPMINTYSKKLYVGMPKGLTDYEEDLLVKDNTKVYMPDTSKINSFIEYIEQQQDAEFSDSDEL
jgi:hypothetical protein